MGKKKKQKDRPAAVTGFQWYGPPSAQFAQRNMLAGLTRGEVSGQTVSHYTKKGQGALQKIAKRYGKKILSGIPISSEIMAGIEIAKDLPVVGDVIEGAMSLIGKPSAVFKALKGAIKSIPGLGKVIGTVEDLVGDIPIVGDIVGKAGKAVGKVVDKVTGFLGNLF